ncbi:unnamed protein product [Caenorhabditis sp. 36 PRJEB53466]|nr:unnamed protein product [Caenorhabditis sp. 36 PRJEB53466]
MSNPEDSEPNDAYDFAVFDEFFDDFSRHEQVANAGAKTSILPHCKYIEGFENWPLMNDDCKKLVIECLDYKTRCKLGQCSKADYAVVQKTPIPLYRISLIDSERSHYSFEKEEFDNVVVSFRFGEDYNTSERYELIFSQIREHTQIRWLQFHPKKRPEKQSVTLENSNYYEEAVKFAENMIKRSNDGIGSIVVEMEKYPFEKSRIKSLSKCKSVRVTANDEMDMRWWLQKVPEQLDDLDLLSNQDRDTFILSSEFLSIPQVMNARKFYFYCRAAFTDKQFLALKAKKIAFDCVNITDDAVNTFLRKWVKGEGVQHFQQVLLWSTRVPDQEKVTAGLEVRPWDEAFREEARGFCEDYDRVCGRGTTFQICSRVDPYESLTLCFNSDRISIYATGKKYISNKENFTYYSIPL